MPEKYVLSMVLVPADEAPRLHFTPSAVHISNELTLDELTPENFQHMLPTLIDTWLVAHKQLAADARGRPVRAH